MLITKTQLNDIIKNAPSGTTPQQIVNGLIARGYILEGYNEKSGILKNIGREIAKPFVQGAELLGQAALTTKAVAKAGYQSATGQKEAAGKTILSEAKRIEKSRKQPIRLLGGDVERVKTMKEAAGTALNLASNFVGGSGAIKAGTAGVKTGLLSTIKTGARVGAKSGALYGTGEALSEDRNVIRGALMGGATGAITGAAMPVVIGGGIKAAKIITSPFSTAINKIAPALEKAAIKVENVITKATKQDIKHGFKTENVFKYNLGGSLGSSLQKTENLIGELSAKAENLRANAKSNININEIVSSVADELSSNKVRNIGNNKRILNSFKVFVKELEDVAPDGKMNTIDAQKVKVALGKMGSWLNGQRDLDANADEVVANALYTKFKVAIENAVDDPAELKAINKQLSEIIPIQNVLLKRIPVAERNSALSLTDIITAGSGMVDPKGWGLFAVNRLSKSGQFAEGLYKGAQKLKSGATKLLPLEVKLKNIKPGLTIKNVGKKQLLNKTDDLIQEAKKYKSAEEFVKAQGTPVYHGGTEIKEVGNMRSKWGAFYMTDNPTYAKSYGGNKSVLNKMVITKKAKLADLIKPSDDLIKQIDEIISPKATGETIKIKKPDGSFVEVPKTKGGLSNPVHSSADIIQGIKDGKAYYAEMPEVKEALKKLGYDGMITQESKFGVNYGVWNKKVIKTKSQLTDIWNKANKNNKKNPY